MERGTLRRIAPLILGGALIVTAGAADAQTVADCRALLFIDDVQPCTDPLNPGPQGDIVGADACFQQLAPDPEVLFFRAVTRLLRLAEESDSDGPDGGTFTDSLKEMLDQFGFSSDPAPGQCGLTEDGRSLYEFTSSVPPGGMADGSISDLDSFLELDLAAGAYVVAVAPCCNSASSVITGSASGTPREAQQNQFGEYFDVPSDEGDYRVTFGGDVSETQVEGTLFADLGLFVTSPDLIPFTVNSPGRVSIDVLSWELLNEDEVFDLNGDSELKFIDSEIFLFVDDGNLDATDWVNSNNDAPIVLPDDAPRGGDVQTFIDTVGVVAVLDLSIADLEALDDQVAVTITPADRTALEGHTQTEPIALDLGEARLLQSLLQLLKAKLLVSSFVDLDFDMDEIFNLRALGETIRVQMEIIDANPNLLGHRGSPQARAAQAQSALVAAIDAYIEASEHMRVNAGSRPDSMVSIEPPDRLDEAELRFHLRAFQRSLAGPATVFCNRSPVSTSVVDGLNLKVGTSFDGRGMTLDAASYFANPFTLRSVFPEITFDDTHQPKNYIRDADPSFNAFPDPEFNGVLLPLLAGSDCDGDGVQDDGDGSGTVGDFVCVGGQTTSCDDNATYTANGPSGGSCTAGDETAFGRICLADLDCGGGGVCSLAQEDSDGDGSGDVVDRCDDGGGSGVVTIRHGGALYGGDFLGLSVPKVPFFDEIEPGAGIEIGLPFEGVNFDFACGACATASFAAPVPTIGGGESLCGYVSGVPRQITQNDDPVCARHIPSGRRYDFDLLSFRSGGFRSCVDADGGVSCLAAGGETSYSRTVCPEPGQALLALAALATLATVALARRRSRQSGSRIR